jgi:hypothetical protein
VKPAAESLPSDLAAAHAMILAERAARLAAETKVAEAANAQAELSNTEALIAHLKLEIEKLRRTLYGSRSERSARLLDQLELQLEELKAAATEDELAAEKAAEKTQTVRSFQRKRPLRQPFPDNIERERVVLPAPTQCACCGSARLSKLGESVTSTGGGDFRRHRRGQGHLAAASGAGANPRWRIAGGSGRVRQQAQSAGAAGSRGVAGLVEPEYRAARSCQELFRKGRPASLTSAGGTDVFCGGIPVFRGFGRLMDPALYLPLPSWSSSVTRAALNRPPPVTAKRSVTLNVSSA